MPRKRKRLPKQPKCPECNIPFKGMPGYESCPNPECGLELDRGKDNVLWTPDEPVSWGHETMADLKKLYDTLAEWERTPPEKRDPKLRAMLSEDYAHPDIAKLQAIAEVI